MFEVSTRGEGGLQGPPEWHPAPENVKEACRRAAEAAAGRGVDISVLAVREALDNPDISTTLIGFSSPDQVRARALHVGG